VAGAQQRHLVDRRLDPPGVAVEQRLARPCLRSRRVLVTGIDPRPLRRRLAQPRLQDEGLDLDARLRMQPERAVGRSLVCRAGLE
jgi:hypothetical protein